jgi:hypothetical protein
MYMRNLCTSAIFLVCFDVIDAVLQVLNPPELRGNYTTRSRFYGSRSRTVQGPALFIKFNEFGSLQESDFFGKIIIIRTSQMDGYAMDIPYSEQFRLETIYEQMGALGLVFLTSSYAALSHNFLNHNGWTLRSECSACQKNIVSVTLIGEHGRREKEVFEKWAAAEPNNFDMSIGPPHYRDNFENAVKTPAWWWIFCYRMIFPLFFFFLAYIAARAIRDQHEQFRWNITNAVLCVEGS